MSYVNGIANSEPNNSVSVMISISAEGVGNWSRFLGTYCPRYDRTLWSV